MTAIAEIGTCNGCRRCRRLLDGACADCRARFGPKASEILRRIREDPAFAAMCYDMCHEKRKQEFISWFGLPAGCEAV